MVVSLREWRHPIKLSEYEVIFGKVEKLLPPYHEIPEEFCFGLRGLKRVSVDLASTMFFCGLRNPKYFPREGVDSKDAMRHLKAVLGCFSIEFEYKEAGTAFLLEAFFERVESFFSIWDFDRNEILKR